ncbi:MAG: MerR family transcriptional regulator, partial [Dokdonella sp.]|nr:MerR family transcriptional regulator [Dokdonella sp.]
YEQGFTITGARQRLEGTQARMESSISSQIVHQVRMELEEVLQILKR